MTQSSTRSNSHLFQNQYAQFTIICMQVCNFRGISLISLNLVAFSFFLQEFKILTYGTLISLMIAIFSKKLSQEPLFFILLPLPKFLDQAYRSLLFESSIEGPCLFLVCNINYLIQLLMSVVFFRSKIFILKRPRVFLYYSCSAFHFQHLVRVQLKRIPHDIYKIVI